MDIFSSLLKCLLLIQVFIPDNITTITDQAAIDCHILIIVHLSSMDRFIFWFPFGHHFIMANHQVLISLLIDFHFIFHQDFVVLQRV